MPTSRRRGSFSLVFLVAVILLATAYWPGDPAPAAPPTPVPPRVEKGHPKLDGRLAARVRTRGRRNPLTQVLPGLSLAVAPAALVRAVAEIAGGNVESIRKTIERNGGKVEVQSAKAIQFTASMDA